MINDEKIEKIISSEKLTPRQKIVKLVQNFEKELVKEFGSDSLFSYQSEEVFPELKALRKKLLYFNKLRNEIYHSNIHEPKEDDLKFLQEISNLLRDIIKTKHKEEGILSEKAIIQEFLTNLLKEKQDIKYSMEERIQIGVKSHIIIDAILYLEEKQILIEAKKFSSDERIMNGISQLSIYSDATSIKNTILIIPGKRFEIIQDTLVFGIEGDYKKLVQKIENFEKS